jgi:hypothetical protein
VQRRDGESGGRHSQRYLGETVGEMRLTPNQRIELGYHETKNFKQQSSYDRTDQGKKKVTP